MVLPLDDYSSDPGQVFFTEGMTEALISELARLDALSVVSRTSVMQYRGTRRALPDIAEELGVGAILEGSVLRDAGFVRITVQLVDARTDRHLWSESYQRPEREILKLQSEVARAVASEIQMELAPGEATRTRAAVNPEAYESYLKGAHFIDSLSAAEHASAIKYFEQAVEQDPNYAPGWAMLSFAYT